MAKQVLDVGNCSVDHTAIRSLLTRHFDCEVLQAHGADDTLRELAANHIDLVLVNRKLDQDYSDGVEVIRRIKSSDSTAAVPVMLVTNYAEHQDAAEEIGAIRGFGKLEFNKPETVNKLAAFLGEPKGK
jgi:CheY-like chemotaxis protein